MAAFERGVDHAHRDPFGLSSLLFSARTLPLFDKLAATGIAGLSVRAADRPRNLHRRARAERDEACSTTA